MLRNRKKDGGGCQPATRKWLAVPRPAIALLAIGTFVEFETTPSLKSVPKGLRVTFCLGILVSVIRSCHACIYDVVVLSFHCQFWSFDYGLTAPKF
jgi:hypothetical protein